MGSSKLRREEGSTITFHVPEYNFSLLFIIIIISSGNSVSARK